MQKTRAFAQVMIPSNNNNIAVYASLPLVQQGYHETQQMTL